MAKRHIYKTAVDVRPNGRAIVTLIEFLETTTEVTDEDGNVVDTIVSTEETGRRWRERYDPQHGRPGQLRTRFAARIQKTNAGIGIADTLRSQLDTAMEALTTQIVE